MYMIVYVYTMHIYISIHHANIYIYIIYTYLRTHTNLFYFCFLLEKKKHRGFWKIPKLDIPYIPISSNAGKPISSTLGHPQETNRHRCDEHPQRKTGLLRSKVIRAGRVEDLPAEKPPKLPRHHGASGYKMNVLVGVVMNHSSYSIFLGAAM